MNLFLARLSLVALLLSPLVRADDIRIGVLGLFHPSELELEPARTQALSVSGENKSWLLNSEPDHRRIYFHAVGERVITGGLSAAMWKASARNGDAVRFQLSVPGKMKRTYEGTLAITAHQGELIAIVTMDREIAVASIIASEMPANTPIEALNAQAVVTRSFLIAGRRHHEFDFCDTTHCQYLRSPDDADSRIRAAVNATHGIVLAYHRIPLAAMYSSRCGGRTRNLREAGMNPGDGYPYYSVPCRWCREHPVHWQRRLTPGVESPEPGNEAARIAFARQWGWSALPGNRFSVNKDAEGGLLEGNNIGHGIGMCQTGATGMAIAGADYRSILEHYYPNSELILLP
jgi:peptidoglycan hydrolase-like amidase